MGELACLNVAGGDIKITFDTADAAEAIRAKRMIGDMLKRGYALLIEVDGKFRRCKRFDAEVGEYIIADFDSSKNTKEVEHGQRETEESTANSSQSESMANTAKKRGRPSKSKDIAVPMAKAKARAVAPSSGG